MTTNIQEVTPEESTSRSPIQNYLGSFTLRLFALSIFIAGIMFSFNVNIGAIGQGLSYSLVGVAVFITFRILEFPDLTVDGSFPIGGAVFAVMVIAGQPAEFVLLAAFMAGALTGLVTALINVFFKIEGLLASIIVITGAFTITLRIMDGTSNLPLMSARTITSPYKTEFREWLMGQFGENMRRHSNNILEIVAFGLVVAIALLLLNWFMHTELGLTIRAAGKNNQMLRALGINHNWMIILGLMISNGLVGIAGALTVQNFGYADVRMGFGVIIRGLAAVMIGEVLLRPKTIGQHIVAVTAGMLIFDFSRAWVVTSFDLPTTDFRLVSALVVLTALAAPNINDRWRNWQKKQKRGVI